MKPVSNHECDVTETVIILQHHYLMGDLLLIVCL